MVCKSDASALKNLPDEAGNRKTKFRRLSSTRGFKTGSKYGRLDSNHSEDISHVDIYKTGWIRVHDGPEPFVIAVQSRLVNIKLHTTITEIREMLSLPVSLSIWMQVGQNKASRMDEEDCPFRIQDDLFSKMGYKDESRRIRLGIDPDIRHAFRFHVGPAGPEPSGAYRGGVLLVLKGLVFPQWRLRSAVVIGNNFMVYSECSERESTMVKLRGARISLCLPRSRRLVLEVSTMHDERLFLGFRTQWERNLWFSWLTEISRIPKVDGENLYGYIKAIGSAADIVIGEQTSIMIPHRVQV